MFPRHMSLIVRWPIVLLACWACGADRSDRIGPGGDERASIERQFSGQMAVSMRVLQADLERCQSERSCRGAILRLDGMTRIDGYVVDDDNGDVVVYGTSEPNRDALFTSDLVIAARNVWLRYAERKGNALLYSHPGVSIDPRPLSQLALRKVGNEVSSVAARRNGLVETANRVRDQVQYEKLSREIDLLDSKYDKTLVKWLETCRADQDVRVLGVPENSHFAWVMFDADYRMKKYADGSETIAGVPLKSMSDLSLESFRDALWGKRDRRQLRMNSTRFWFYPGEHAVEVGTGIAELVVSKVILLDEAQTLSRSGHSSAASFVDEDARRFSAGFSRLYEEIADQAPVYRELQNLFRVVAVMQTLSESNAVPRFERTYAYLLDRYQHPRTHVPKHVEGVGRVSRNDVEGPDGTTHTLRPTSCGGVKIKLGISRATFRPASPRVTLLEGRVREARPGPKIRAWSLE